MRGEAARNGADIVRTLILAEPLAGLQAQALGLAEAAGLTPEVRSLQPKRPWRWLSPSLWPNPAGAVGMTGRGDPGNVVLIGAGGKAGAVCAALRRKGRPAVQVQHPRMDPRRFDLVIVQRHDGLRGPNVLVTRTALNQASPLRLAAGKQEWAATLAHLPRPLVSVLVGGSNGRYRLDAATARRLAAELGGMITRDGAGIALTPSRRTAPEVRRILADTLTPLGAWVWDGQGANPYFGLLGLADLVVVTADSVSMASEAAATRAPVLLAPLPGKSRRIAQFMQDLVSYDRARPFRGRVELWPVDPLNDTQDAADEMCRRLKL